MGDRVGLMERLMPRVIPVLCGVALAASLTVATQGQTPASGRAVAYEGARLIVGDASAPIEAGVMVVQDGRIVAVGPKGSVTVPAGAAHVDLTGRTVMPALV